MLQSIEYSQLHLVASRAARSGAVPVAVEVAAVLIGILSHARLFHFFVVGGGDIRSHVVFSA